MKRYLIALRAPFLAGSIVPVLISAAWAFKQNLFSLPHTLLTIFGVAFLHLGSNLINDYYDARGSDPINFRLTPFSGGSRAIQELGIRPWVILAMSIFSYSMASALGILLISMERSMVIFFGLTGLFLGWAYSSPPFSLMTRGWGELAIFLAFGPILTLASFYAITGKVDMESFLLGIPQGFFITNVLWINQFPDIEADERAGKRNLVVRMGAKNARYLYGVFLITGVLFPFALTGLAHVPQLILLSLIAAPLGFKAFYILWKHYHQYQGLIPGQALTIQFLIAHGLLMSLGIILAKIF